MHLKRQFGGSKLWLFKPIEVFAVAAAEWCRHSAAAPRTMKSSSEIVLCCTRGLSQAFPELLLVDRQRVLNIPSWCEENCRKKKWSCNDRRRGGRRIQPRINMEMAAILSQNNKELDLVLVIFYKFNLNLKCNSPYPHRNIRQLQIFSYNLTPPAHLLPICICAGCDNSALQHCSTAVLREMKAKCSVVFDNVC